MGWGHFLIQLYVHHAGSSGLPLPVCLHLGTLAECLSTERLLWSYSRALLRAPTKVSAGIAPGCAHQVTILRTAWKKGVLLSQSQKNTHAWFWITGTPMPGSGSRVHPCSVLDHKLVCLGLVTLCGPESEADTVLAAEDTGLVRWASSLCSIV